MTAHLSYSNDDGSTSGLLDLGFSEIFSSRPDEPIATRNDWIDASDLYGPDYFDQLIIRNGRVTLEPVPTNIESHDGGDPNLPPSEVVGHGVAGIHTGMTDDFEVRLSIEYAVDTFEAFIQAGPFVRGDLLSENPLHMGLTPVNDVSINASYIQNVFRQKPITDVFDPDAYYLALTGSNTSWDGGTAYLGRTVEWIVRCVDGKIRYWVDGEARCPVIDVAATAPWAIGESRDVVGIHCIHSHIRTGTTTPYLPGYISPGTDRMRVTRFSCVPYSTPL